MRRLMRFSILLAVLSPAAARSATLRVPTEYSTINQALGAATSGDTVLVAPGTDPDCEIRNHGVALVGSSAFLEAGVAVVSESGPEVTRLDLQGAAIPNARLAYARELDEEAVLSGFTLTGAPPGGHGVVTFFSEKMIVENSIFLDR
jgi:hypothetical protein